MTIAETTPGTSSLRSVGGGERETARQHLVERDAGRVEVGPRIDRTVHASRLLRGHVGQRTGDDLGWLGCLTFAPQARGNPEAHQPHPAGRGVDQEIRWLDVLVDDALRVQLAQGEREAHRQAQKEAELHRRPQQPVQRFAAGIVEDQGGPALVLGERDRLSCPCGS